MKKAHDRSHGPFVLVRKMGLEPTRHGHTHLKRACLPIPAHSHIHLCCHATAINIIWNCNAFVKAYFKNNSKNVDQTKMEILHAEFTTYKAIAPAHTIIETKKGGEMNYGNRSFCKRSNESVQDGGC